MNNKYPKTDLDNEGPGQEAQIADYLSTHPDFFDRHLDLLMQLRLPHPTGRGTVSLLERQLHTLRKEAERYRGQLEEFITVARENQSLQQRMHRLTLTLFEPGEGDDLLCGLRAELQNQFDADAVELKLFDPALERHSPGDPTLDQFRRLLDQGRPVCGALKAGQMQALFGKEAEALGSAALIPLKGQGVLGLLAISSRDPNRFHPGKGTEFLVRLGELVNRRLEVALRSPG